MKLVIILFCWESDLYFTILICGPSMFLIILFYYCIPFFVFCLTRSNCWQQLLVEGSEHSAQKSDPHCCLWWALMTWSPLIHPLLFDLPLVHVWSSFLHGEVLLSLGLYVYVEASFSYWASWRAEAMPASRRERQQLVSDVLECRKA